MSSGRISVSLSISSTITHGVGTNGPPSLGAALRLSGLGERAPRGEREGRGAEGAHEAAAREVRRARHGAYLSGLKRMRLGCAASSPRRFILSASYSW